MLNKMKIALALALCASVGGVALANGAGGSGGRPGRAEMIKKYDTNNDGKLDDAERAKLKVDMQAKHAAKKAEHLAKYDANRNGTLDPTERDTMQSDRQVERFKKLDTNNDGKITLDEFKAAKEHLGRGHRGGGMRSHGVRGGDRDNGGFDKD